jgi:hypothetical protein
MWEGSCLTSDSPFRSCSEACLTYGSAIPIGSNTFRPLCLISSPLEYVAAEKAQSVLRLATGWTFRVSNTGGGEIFRTRPDRPWAPLSLLYNGYQDFPEVKRPGRGVDHPPPIIAELKEKV